MEVSKARVYSGKTATHVGNMQSVNAQEMTCTIGVADMHAVFENSKMHMHVTMLLSEMQFKRSVYSTLCGLACSAKMKDDTEVKWSLHGPTAYCRATLA